MASVEMSISSAKTEDRSFVQIEINIEYAMRNPEALRKLLPEILAEEENRADSLLYRIFERTTTENLPNSFRVISREFFRRCSVIDKKLSQVRYAREGIERDQLLAPMLNRLQIRSNNYHNWIRQGFGNLANAQSADQTILDDILAFVVPRNDGQQGSYGVDFERFDYRPRGQMRLYTLHHAICRATEAGNIAMVERLLKEQYFIESLEAVMLIATERNYAEALELFVTDVMGDKAEDAQMLAHEGGKVVGEDSDSDNDIDTQSETVQRNLYRIRGEAIEKSLRVSIARGWENITKILLQPYLQCTAFYHRSLESDADNVLATLPDEAYMIIPREVCLVLQSQEIAAPVMRAIGRRLRMLDAQFDLLITADHARLPAHMHVLQFWSKTFREMPEDQWREGLGLDFSGRFTAENLRILIEYIYTRDIPPQYLSLDRKEDMENLLETFDYFGVDPQASTFVQGALDQIEALEARYRR
ncbi:hypothetical protein BDW59DRAFT_159002 [Aspergillus cavernicola]|uniref:BTB domain-containing protein n=1 Tax=Aspergillus cavernicola TaxID=176166 RepID=A0ABR4INU4_9EURO